MTHTVGSLGWMFASAIKSFKLRPADVALPASSCAHIGGFTFALSALSAGASVAVARAFDHAWAAVPADQADADVDAAEHAHAPHEKDELGSLRLCRSAGDKVPAELENEYMALTGHRISEGYGMTEIGFAALNPPTVVDKLGLIGVPSPGFVFSIRSEDGGEVASGTEGRLFVRTRSRTAGYWNDPGASAEVIREDWLDTGDVMRADDDGYLWFCGQEQADHRP